MIETLIHNLIAYFVEESPMLTVSPFCEVIECYELESKETKLIVFNCRTMRYLIMTLETWRAIESQEFDKLSSFIVAMLIKHNILINDTEDEMLTLAMEEDHVGCDHSALYFVIRPLKSKVVLCEFCNTVIDVEFATTKVRKTELQ